MSDLTWHRRKGLGGLYAAQADGYYDISLSLAGDAYVLALVGDHKRQTLGRFAKQVEAKRAAEAHAE